MQRAELLAHLVLGERHVAHGAATIRRQRRLIAELADGGHDTTRAQALLEEFQRTQALHVAELELVRSELARSGPRSA